MMMKTSLKRGMSLVQKSNATGALALAANRMQAVPLRSFGLTKYKFDDEDWERNQFQVCSAPLFYPFVFCSGRLTDNLIAFFLCLCV